MEQYVKYLRKSRYDRDYAELSIEETLKRHEAILDKLASDRGYHIAKTYHEVVSGESIAARPEIQKMLEEVGAGIYAGVLVVDIERLARGNGADQAYISQIFQFTGTKIITPSKVYDPSNEFDEEYFEFGLFMSRREYKTINRRLIRGRDSSASEGKYISSIPPYGYKKVKLEKEKGFTLEPDENEAWAVKKVFELYYYGEGTKNIAHYLNDHGAPTRHGDLWDSSTVMNMLTNPIYIGKIRRGWSKQYKTLEDGVVKKHVKRAKNYGEYTVYDGLHPALVSEDVFMRVQEIRESRKPLPRVHDNQDLKNPFAGLFYCAICGKPMERTMGTIAKGQRQRFRCRNGGNCHNSSADYEIVEEEIIFALKDWLEGYTIKVDQDDFEDDIIDCQAQIERLERQAESINAQLEKAYNLVEQGIYTLELFQSRRSKLTTSLDEVKEQQDKLFLTLSALQQGAETHAKIIPQTEALLASYRILTNREKNSILKEIVERIEYRKDTTGEITIDLYPRLPKAQG